MKNQGEDEERKQSNHGKPFWGAWRAQPVCGGRSCRAEAEGPGDGLHKHPQVGTQNGDPWFNTARTVKVADLNQVRLDLPA